MIAQIVQPRKNTGPKTMKCLLWSCESKKETILLCSNEMIFKLVLNKDMLCLCFSALLLYFKISSWQQTCCSPVVWPYVTFVGFALYTFSGPLCLFNCLCEVFVLQNWYIHKCGNCKSICLVFGKKRAATYATKLLDHYLS